MQTFFDRLIYRAGNHLDQSLRPSGVYILRSMAALMVVALITSGCSSTRLAYRYADWGIIWWVEDYVTLTQTQEKQLNADIETLINWHCRSELTRYRSWLGNIQNHLASGDIGPEQISSLQNQLMAFLPPLVDQITPAAIHLLSSLSDDQVSELAGNMAEKHRELEDKFLAGDAEKIAKARAERTTERVERWLGSLNHKQQKIVDDWSKNRAGQTKIWLQGRKKWQEALLVALNNRHRPGFGQTTTDLINNPQAARGGAYREMMKDATKAMTNIIQALLKASNPSHLDHLVDRTSELRDDFKALSCKAGPEAVSRALE